MDKFWSCLQDQGISPGLIAAAKKAETDAQDEFQQVAEIVKLNQLKVLNAFRQAGIS